jgi:multidrug efflux pump
VGTDPAGAMQHLPGLQDVSSDQQNGGLDELMNYDRVTAAKLGLTVQSLDSALYGAFGQSEVSIIYTQLNQYYVVLEVAPQYWQSPEGLKDIYLQSSSGGNIPLLAVAKARPTPHPWPSTIRAYSPRSPCPLTSRRTCL